MIKARPRRFGFLVSAWSVMLGATASAQMAPTPTQGSSTGMPSAAMMANPYLNPYLNPYMNPMATQQPMNSGNALLYLYAANSANGGMGSGRLSGTRGAAPVRKAAEMPNEVARPGGGAARFFNPGPVNANRTGRYYNQRSRYFQSNGR